MPARRGGCHLDLAEGLVPSELATVAAGAGSAPSTGRRPNPVRFEWKGAGQPRPYLWVVFFRMAMLTQVRSTVLGE
jgi:hypothetical protein